MMLVIPVALAAALAGAAQPDALSVRARLDAYERGVAASGRPDAAELKSIATLAITRERRSPKFAAWSEACASSFVPESDDCTPRLRAVLNRASEPLARRAEAASALIARGETSAAATLAEVLKTSPPSTLASLAPILASMPAARAVPLLVRLLGSPSATDQAAACRVIGAFDHQEVRDALARAIAGQVPGTEAWLLCNVARARAGASDARLALWGYGHSLQGDGMLFATQTMLEVGDREAALEVLTDLTRRGSTASRVDAALLLAESRPDIAMPVIDAALNDPEGRVRAAALRGELLLKRKPDKAVRAMLLDTDELVRIAAAEAVIAWARRQ